MKLCDLENCPVCYSLNKARTNIDKANAKAEEELNMKNETKLNAKAIKEEEKAYAVKCDHVGLIDKYCGRCNISEPCPTVEVNNMPIRNETKLNAKLIREEEKTYELKLESAEIHTFKSGAKSSEVKYPYHLVPIEAIQFIAERFGYGMKTHGAWNWVKGLDDPAFIQDRKNHAVDHLLCYNLGLTTKDKNGNIDTPLDHLKAAITNCAMFCYMEMNKKEENVLPTTPLAKG